MLWIGATKLRLLRDEVGRTLRASTYLFAAAICACSAEALADEAKSGASADKLQPIEWKYDRRMEKLLAPTLTWDLNVEGAYGHIFSDPSRSTFLGRARAGLLLVRRPFYWALGPTYEISALSDATFGVQGEVTWLAYGPWAQVGALMDVGGHKGAAASLGFMLFGVEAQLRDAEATGTAWSIFGKVRLPIAIFYRALAVSAEVREEREREQREREEKAERARQQSVDEARLRPE